MLNVERFVGTFSNINITEVLPITLFDNCLKATNFAETFRSCTELTGNAPSLWSRSDITDSTLCFASCLKLSNYTSIPPEWKE